MNNNRDRSQRLDQPPFLTLPNKVKVRYTTNSQYRVCNRLVETSDDWIIGKLNKTRSYPRLDSMDKIVLIQLLNQGRDTFRTWQQYDIDMRICNLIKTIVWQKQYERFADTRESVWCSFCVPRYTTQPGQRGGWVEPVVSGLMSQYHDLLAKKTG